MSTVPIHLIGAAVGLGAPDPRCAEGPDRLRTRLAARGKLRGGVIWRKTIRAKQTPSKKFPPSALLPFCRQLAQAVRASIVGGARFVVVGGDHSCAIGTWQGAAKSLPGRAPLGMIWIDAHMDAHTPATSHSGHAHGMPLASLLGSGSLRLTKGSRPPLSPSHTCLIGVRSFEPQEEKLLAQLGVKVYRCDEVRRRGLVTVMEEALSRVQAGAAAFGISIDIDAIDPREAPGVTTPAANGLYSAELIEALRKTVERPGFLGVEIAEFNPALDRDGRTATIVESLIDVIAAARPLDASADLERRYCARNYEPLPVVLTRGKGVHVWDTAGRRYIDMMAAYSAVSFGHAHPRLVRALNRQAQRLTLVSRAYYTDRLGPLAERLCELTGFDRMLPMNTGAEAVETALKAARKWAYKVKGVMPNRAEIICCNGNFHGRTLAAVGMSSEPQYRDGFGPFAPGFVQIPYGDAAALEAAIAPNTAAFLVEPIQGEGGIIVPPEGYLAACAEICQRHNVLLLCDEVQTGLGRTGRLLACEHDGVKPDAVLLGKALSGGFMPISAFLARREVMDVFTPGDHGSTFGGNPLACTVALEALDILIEGRLIEHAVKLGDYLQQCLKNMRHPLVRALRGKGLFIGMDLEAGRVNARTVCEAMLRHGILTKDTHHTVLRFVPPLTITKSQLDDALERIERALGEFDDAADPPSRLSAS